MYRGTNVFPALLFDSGYKARNVPDQFHRLDEDQTEDD
jgi:hypothetical protein